jgi:hypothetical protein
MKPNEIDDPTNELDRRIFHVLSHGQKRQTEIVTLLSTTRFTDRSVREHTRDLSENYSWAVEIDDGDTYYYRKDIGRQPTLRKSPADYSDIEQLLTDIEIKLGIKSRDDLPGARNKSPTLPELFDDFLREANVHSQILNTDDHLVRYFDCFDKILTQTENGYSSNGAPPNYPAKTHALFYTVTAEQHEGWKSGQSHEKFDKFIRERLSSLVDLLEFVPPNIGNPILRILAIVDIEIARDGFKNMIRSNKYSHGVLSEHAESCYIYSNESNKLIKHLNIIKSGTGNNQIKNKIREIKKEMRSRS